MIKGVDIGNFATKDELGNQFESKCTKVSNILGNNHKITVSGNTFYMGNGSFDTEYRKIRKENYLNFLFTILAMSKADEHLQLVLGLPLSQYKEDKENLKKLITDNRLFTGTYNDAFKQFIIEDIEVYPEGIGAVPQGFEGIICDIGGLTTDCCATYVSYNSRKIDNPISLAQGTLNLYTGFINTLNNRFCLDLQLKDVDRILKSGLIIDNEKQDIKYAIEVSFKAYLDDLIKRLNVEYSLKTNKVFFTGGGSLLLRSAIINRLSNAIISDSACFDNAKGFYNRGLQLWG